MLRRAGIRVVLIGLGFQLAGCGGSATTTATTTTVAPRSQTPTSASTAPGTERYLTDVKERVGVAPGVPDQLLVLFGQDVCKELARGESPEAQEANLSGISRGIAGAIVEAAQADLCPQVASPHPTASTAG